MSDGESRSAPRFQSMHPVTGRPLSLRLYPDSVLRSTCHPIEDFDGWLSDVVDEMLALMRIHSGIGLAAPQVGITQRFFVAEINGRSVCLVNPVLVTRQGWGRMTEGCLSLPGIDVNVQRNLQIEVQGFDVHGCTQRYHVEGLWARVMQHEIDHLDGILICDYKKKRSGADSEQYGDGSMQSTGYRATEIEVGFHPDGYRIDKTAGPMNRYTKWEIHSGDRWTHPTPVCFDSLPVSSWFKTDGFDWDEADGGLSS